MANNGGVATMSLYICSVLLTIFSSTVTTLTIKLCDVNGSTKCSNLTTALATKVTLECKMAPNIYRCMQYLRDGTADILPVSDTDLYPAGKFMGLRPFIQQVLTPNDTFRYKAVIAVKKDGTIKKLSDLKNKVSCHTAAGKTTGWTVPVSNLQKKGIIPIKDCYNTILNVADYFAESCIPGGYSSKIFNPFNLNPPRICKACITECYSNDTYSGYDGSLKCLIDGPGDVSFVSHKEVQNNNKVAIVCPDGNVKDKDQYENCNWATRPTDSIVISPKVTNDQKNEISKILIDNADAVKKHLQFASEVKTLRKYDGSYKDIMGEGFENTFEYYHNCKSALKWCTISEDEKSKCTDFKLAFAAKRATNKLECVLGTDAMDCVKKIKDDTADFVVLDGGHIYDSECDVKPVIAETHITEKGAQEAAYYAVAVVKKSSKLTFKTLKGAKSCHTGIGKTSGWKVPIGLLVGDKLITDTNPVSVGKYFAKSCVPGALDKDKNIDGKNPENLCALCPNNGKNCSMNANNKYYGYTGAFRCLVEADDADVAFVKHVTVFENTDGKGETWAKTLRSQDYELLCRDGKRAPVTEWLKCNLAKVPSHAVVVKNSNMDMGKRLYSVFNYLDLSKDKTKKLLFSSNEGSNLLFKDSAVGLSYISNSKSFLSSDYRKVLSVFNKKQECGSSATQLTVSAMMLISVLAMLL